LTPSTVRPLHELKAFRKVFLKAGDSQQVEVVLGDDAFSYYDAAAAKWKLDPGKYEIQVGNSSRDLPAVAPLEVTDPTTPPR
jgi:beta-glucosidase